LKSVEGPLEDKDQNESEPQAKRPKLEIKTNPRVFFDIEIGGNSTGKMIFQVTCFLFFHPFRSPKLKNTE